MSNADEDLGAEDFPRTQSQINWIRIGSRNQLDITNNFPIGMHLVGVVHQNVIIKTGSFCWFTGGNSHAIPSTLSKYQSFQLVNNNNFWLSPFFNIKNLRLNQVTGNAIFLIISKRIIRLDNGSRVWRIRNAF